jgi:hypothetical protein
MVEEETKYLRGDEISKLNTDIYVPSPTSLQMEGRLEKFFSVTVPTCV